MQEVKIESFEDRTVVIAVPITNDVIQRWIWVVGYKYAIGDINAFEKELTEALASDKPTRFGTCMLGMLYESAGNWVLEAGGPERKLVIRLPGREVHRRSDSIYVAGVEILADPARILRLVRACREALENAGSKTPEPKTPESETGKH